MSIDSVIIRKFLDNSSIVNIKAKINEMEPPFHNYHSIITMLPEIEINVDYLNIYKTCFFEVARLSINLFVDFLYYKRFKFKEHSTNLLYKERLCALGYECENGIWKYSAIHEPNKLIIQENIFIYYSFCQLLESKKKENSEFTKKCEIFNESPNESSDVDEPILVSRSGNRISSNQENKTNNFVTRPKISDKAENSLDGNEDELILKSFGTQSRESWICKQCSFVNDIDLNNCGTCFLSDPLEENSPSLTNEPEKLESDYKIELENSIMNFVEVDKSIHDYWICPNCTFKNNSDRLNCETCLNLKDINTTTINEYLPDPMGNPIENRQILHRNENIEGDSIKNPDLQKLNESIEVENINSNKESLGNCLKCKKNIDKNQKNLLCVNCSKSHAVCCNEACMQINKANYSFCQKCKVKKNSNMKNGNLFNIKSYWILYNKRWQCSFCFLFNSRHQKACKKCRNSRYNTVQVG